METETPRKKFLVVMSTGANEPKKAFTPFYYAAAAASMDLDTTMFFLAEAPSLLRPGVAETIRTKAEGDPLTKVIDLGRRNGVKFLCCSVSAKVIWDIEDGGLPDGMEFAGAATLLEMAADPSVSVLYF
ncbi:MAG TPA: DsrE family protein [Candidatus Binataceae bacterium]|nr:DsrE family protein [Candidatus Binataceae bacterium]